MRNLMVITSTLLAGSAVACDLKVESAWIREAPSNATALAGYATLSNVGSKPVLVASIQSAAFAEVQPHESITENGLAKMRAIDKLVIGPGTKVEFAPGGKHFMMMNPKSALHSGDAVVVKLKDGSGCETTASFKVSRGAPLAATMDHVDMDHSKMNH
jgi:copper(I)-binding protein